MKNLIARLLLPAEQKASRTARLIELVSPGRARWTPRDYAALAREGFVANAIVHRAIKLVAENVGALAFLVYEGAQALDKHPLAALLARPNPRQDGPGFLEAVTAYLLISGNSYIEAVSSTARCANSTRCGRTACASCRGRTAGRRRTSTR